VFLPDTIFKFKKIENCKLFFSDLEKMDIIRLPADLEHQLQQPW
jgi:hypothetical protein